MVDNILLELSQTDDFMSQTLELCFQYYYKKIEDLKDDKVRLNNQINDLRDDCEEYENIIAKQTKEFQKQLSPKHLDFKNNTKIFYRTMRNHYGSLSPTVDNIATYELAIHLLLDTFGDYLDDEKKLRNMHKSKIAQLQRYLNNKNSGDNTQ